MKILFVDDEVVIAELGKFLIEQLGYKVVASIDPLNALYLFSQNPEKFDLVITDYNMPRLRGDKLAAKILDIRVDIPILLCTGNVSFERKDMNALGFSDILRKPFNSEDIDVAIKKLLKH